jgi:putative flippase GtrA
MFNNIKKIATYLFNGIINTSITYPSFIVLSDIIDYRIAISIIFPLGALLSYFMNKKLVFKKERGSITIFFIIVTTMYLTNLSITWILVEFGDISKEISQAIAIFIAFIGGYLLNKKFSFKKVS